jgi:hypothetical protein
MKATAILALLVILTLPLLADSPKGTVPRSTAARYAAHATIDGTTLGATLLTSKQVHKVFTTDLTPCCLVVEVALYPEKDKQLDVWPDDFVLRLTGTDTAVKPTGAQLLAWQLQKRNTDSSAVSTVAVANIGYESGTDPRMGQHEHAVEAGGGVGVGVGRDPAAAQASADRDRNAMEMELNEKSLPEDTVSAPIAGYLYFALPKDNKKAAHQLEYTLNGQKVFLNLN